jgi:hypothetical protein
MFEKMISIINFLQNKIIYKNLNGFLLIYVKWWKKEMFTKIFQSYYKIFTNVYNMIVIWFYFNIIRKWFWLSNIMIKRCNFINVNI